MDTEIPILQYQPSSTTTAPLGSFGHHIDVNDNNNNSGSSNLLHNELHVVRYAGRQAVCNFLQNYKCLSILKVSTKIIVFDIQTPIQLAFYALVEHGMCVSCVGDELLLLGKGNEIYFWNFALNSVSLLFSVVAGLLFPFPRKHLFVTLQQQIRYVLHYGTVTSVSL